MLSLDEIERTPERIRELSPYDAQEMLARIAALIPPLNAALSRPFGPHKRIALYRLRMRPRFVTRLPGGCTSIPSCWCGTKTAGLKGALTLRSNNSYGESYERRRPNLQAQRFDDLAYSGLDSIRASRVEAIDQHRQRAKGPRHPARTPGISTEPPAHALVALRLRKPTRADRARLSSQPQEAKGSQDSVAASRPLL